ncbi:MAG TPA: hypothetical protein VG755_16610 [Nannocystaceae bacterium]|nr:hypothetical protein [Nannocystaceae bacterium]
MKKWILALALCGCGVEAPPQPQPRAVADRFVVGDVLRYRFEWRVEAATDESNALPDADALVAGVDFAGELELRVHDGGLLGVKLVALDRHAITMMGLDTLPDASALIGRESFVELDAEGNARALWFDRDAPSVLRHVVPGLLAQIDLHVPAAAHAQVPAGAGLADVEYAWAGSARIVRTLRGYARFDAHPSASAPDVDGRVEIALDDAGVPLRIDGSEEVWTRGDERDGFHSATSFALARIATTHAEATAAPALDQLVRVDPRARPDDEDTRRAMAQRFAGELSALDVAMAIHAAAGGMPPAPELLVQETGRLRGWPELADELAPLFATYDDPAARTLVLDMLASGGTPEAQAVMRELLDDPQLRAQPHYGSWLQRFSFVWRPQPATIAFLLATHDRAIAEQDDANRRAVLYPLGTVASRIAAIDPVASAMLSARIDDALTHAIADEDRVAAIAGLGNAAARTHEGSVLAHATSASPDVRAAVAIALRHSDSTASTAALVQLVDDRDPLVAAAALSVLDHRRTGPDDGVRLAGIAFAGSFTPELAGRLTSALGRHRDDDPWVRAALVAMRTRTSDPRERARIDAIVADAG